MKRREILTGALTASCAASLAPLAFAWPARAATHGFGRVGLGTWRVFDAGAGPAVLRAFAELGGGVVDTAPSYGSEGVIGDVRAAALRDGARDGARGDVSSAPATPDAMRALWIATKVLAMGRNDAKAQVTASLKALRTERIDLVQVHNLFHLDEALDVLEGLKHDGVIRHVGVTHVNAGGHDELERALRRRAVDFVQVNYSAGEREAERRLLPAARDRGVAVLVNRPFMGGDLLRLTSGRAPPEGFTSWSDALLRFALSHPAVSCAIPATSSVAHLRANMSAAAAPVLGDGERARIARALA